MTKSKQRAAIPALLDISLSPSFPSFASVQNPSVRSGSKVIVTQQNSAILFPMPVENRIVKVQKRNRALVRFDAARIRKAILRAAQSIGGFKNDYLPGINEKIFAAWNSDEEIAEFLAEAVVVCLNADPHRLIANFPPTIETIQDEVLHALRSYGFQNTADAYGCYRWGRHWLREGAINPGDRKSVV